MAYGFNQQPQNLTVQQTLQQGNQMGNPQNIQPLFPQPQGNVYNINSTLEVANVPVGAGVSVALCLPENVMYIKTMQNGNPLFYPYKITPFTNEPMQEEKQTATISIEQLASQLKQCIEKVEDLESKIKTKQKGADLL